MDFKSKFKKLRKSMGYTQSRFGEIFGLTQVGISELESGKKKPSKTLMAYLKYRFSNIFGEDAKIGKADEPQLNDDANRVMIEYQNTIKRFKDPKRGLRIIKKIIILQEINPKLLEQVERYLTTTHETAQTMMGNQDWDELELSLQQNPEPVAEEEKQKKDTGSN